MPILIEAEQSLRFDQILYALGIRVQQFNGLIVLRSDGLEELVGFAVQAAGVERKNVDGQTEFSDEIDEYDVFSAAERQGDAARFKFFERLAQQVLSRAQACRQ